MKILIDIPQDHKRVIDNLVSDGKGYLLPQVVETRLAKAVKFGTVFYNNCEICERYDKTGKTKCNGCDFKLACIPLVLVKHAREELAKIFETNKVLGMCDYTVVNMCSTLVDDYLNALINGEDTSKIRVAEPLTSESIEKYEVEYGNKLDKAMERRGRK